MHTLIGNLTRDPETALDAQIPRVQLSIAVSERYRDDDGRWRNKPAVFWTCWTWRDRAKNIAATRPEQGTPVILVGKFRTASWRNRSGVEKRQTVFDIHHFGVDVTFLRREQQGELLITASETLREPDEGRDTTHAWDETEQVAAPIE